MPLAAFDRMSITAFAGALLISSAINVPDMPVTVSDVTTGASSHVRVTNTASQPVTAWSLAVTSEKPGGGLHREVYTTEGYLSEVTHGLPRAAERLERLMPGESRELPLDPLPEGAKARSHCGGDGRWDGDRRRGGDRIDLREPRQGARRAEGGRRRVQRRAAAPSTAPRRSRR